MKKRIISLALVIVMLLSLLCSCSFNYAKKNLAKYATFDATEFEKALLGLVIADGDFGRNQNDRNKNVLDTIFAALASDAGTDNKSFDVVVKEYDVLYYGYYATFTKTEKVTDENGEETEVTTEYVVFPEGMNPAKPGGLQFGLSSTKEDSLAGKIEAAVGDQVVTNVFKGNTDGTAAEGDIVNVSFTFTYTVTDAEGNSKSETIVYNYVNLPLTLAEAVLATVNEDETTEDETTGDETTGDETTGDETTGDETTGDETTGDEPTVSDPTVKPELKQNLVEYLVGKTVGKVGEGKFDGKLTHKDVTYEGAFTGLTINWIVEDEGQEIATVTDKTYSTAKSVKDIYGNTHDLKDVELTYHVYPMYVVDVVDELTTEVVLKKLLGTDSNKNGSVEDSEKGSLAIFSSEEYKNGEETLKALVEKLVTAYNDLAKAEKALVAAKDAFEKEKANASTATPATVSEDETVEGGETTDETTGDETTEGGESTETPTEPEKSKAEKEYDSAVQDVAAKKLAVSELVNKIADAAKGEEKVSAILADEYKKAVYDNLEATYESTIRTNIATEVVKLATKYITFTGKLPTDAVNNAYNRIKDMYEYNYYQGNYTNADKTTVPNYNKYGSFEEYLKTDKNALNLG